MSHLNKYQSEQFSHFKSLKHQGFVFRKASMDDADVIQQIEQASFGVHIIREELEQIIEEGKGEVFLTIKGDDPIAYLILLYENIDEKRLQPLLRAAKANGEKVMHDDTHIEAGKEVYFHLLGVNPDYHNQKIGQTLIAFALNNLPEEMAKLEKTACIRVNNLGSLRAVMKQLGMSMVSRKAIATKTFDGFPMIGSIETNFNASDRIQPITEISDIKLVPVWLSHQDQPNSDSILIPIIQGEEDELDQTVVSQIDTIMTNGDESISGKYVMYGVFKGNEISLDPKFSYLYFERS